MWTCKCAKCSWRVCRIYHYLYVLDNVFKNIDKEVGRIIKENKLPSPTPNIFMIIDQKWALLILVKNEFNYYNNPDRDDVGLFSNIMSDNLLLNCPWELLEEFDICCNFTSFLRVVVEILYTIKQNLVDIINEVKRIQKDSRLSKKSRKRKAVTMESMDS
jgi:hypothetical protein